MPGITLSGGLTISGTWNYWARCPKCHIGVSWMSPYTPVPPGFVGANEVAKSAAVAEHVCRWVA